MKQIAGFLIATVLIASAFLLVQAYGARQTARKNEYIVYIGTYTRQQSKGIYAFRFDPATGKATFLGLVAETANPSFLAIHPSQNLLYAVNEVSMYAGQRTGSISAFSIDPEAGRLNLLNTVASRGDSPCHLTLDQSGRFLYVANYGSGSVAVLPVNQDGSLAEASGFVQHMGGSIHPQRQQGPHAHEVVLSPDNRFALVPDLGLDKILVYRTDATKGTLAPNIPGSAMLQPGSGPRHLAFHPNGRFAYVINELRSTVTVFAYDPKKGSLKELQTVSALPKDFTGNSTCAEIAVHPNGKSLYASNRGHDSIVVFAIDSRKGTLSGVEHAPTRGKTPRHFAIDPTGAYLFAANQGTNNVVLFRIDQNNGRLIPTGETIEVVSPVCVTFLQSR